MSTKSLKLMNTADILFLSFKLFCNHIFILRLLHLVVRETENVCLPSAASKDIVAVSDMEDDDKMKVISRTGRIRDCGG